MTDDKKRYQVGDIIYIESDEAHPNGQNIEITSVDEAGKSISVVQKLGVVRVNDNDDDKRCTHPEVRQVVVLYELQCIACGEYIATLKPITEIKKT